MALLDTYPALTGYSLRQLLNSATSAIRVRRSSDNSEQDIGFDGNGNLDVSSLETFCSGTNGYVRTWYNQGSGGATYDLQQTSNGSQPLIVTNGSVELNTGKPTLKFNGSSHNMTFPSGFLYNATEISTYLKMAAPLQQNDAIIGPVGNFGRGFELVHTNVVNWPTLVRINNSRKYETGVWYTNGDPGLSTIIATSSATSAWLDSVALTPASGISALNWNGVYGLGVYAGGGTWSEMDLQELIIDTSDKTSERASVEADIAAYYVNTLPITGTGALTLPAIVASDYKPRLFNTYPSLTGYSLRQLNKEATSAVRVRRSSDSAEQDIGFDSEGNLDTTSLESFCSGADGYVRTWYNQGTGGGTYDLQQTFAGNQPLLVSSGSVIVLERKPAIRFNGTSSYMRFPSGFLYNATNVTNYFMMSAPLQNNDAIMGPDNNNTRGYELVHTNVVSWPTLVRINGGRKYETGVWHTDSTQGLSTIIATSSATSAWLDSVALTPVSGISAINWNGVYSIGRYSNGGYSEMDLQEFIIDTSDQSADRASVEDEIRTYYSEIPPRLLNFYPSITGYSLRQINNTSEYAVRVRRSSDNSELNIGFDINGDLSVSSLESFCSGTDGFVVTWYNQGTGGATYDLTQSNTTNQPKIVDSGSVETLEGEPVIKFNGTNSYLPFPSGFLNGATNLSIFSMMSAPQQTNDGIFGPSTTSGNGIEFSPNNQVDWDTLVRINNTTYYDLGVWYTDNSQGLTTLIGTPSSTQAWLDGNALEAKNAMPALNYNGVYAIGLFNGSSYGEVSMQEFIVDTSDQSADRSSIETNMQNHYQSHLTPLLMDTYPSITAFSLRQLAATATSAIRVRRSSDNAEQDIGFSNGDLDTTALESFCSGTNGFVHTWYNQGTGRTSYDLIQTTADSQPLIVTNGSTELLDEKPAVIFDGSDDYFNFTVSNFSSYRYLYNKTNISIFMRLATPLQNNAGILGPSASSGQGLELALIDSSGYPTSVSMNNSRKYTTGVWNTDDTGALSTIVGTPSATTAWLEDTGLTPQSAMSALNYNQAYALGRYNSSQYCEMSLQEIIINPTDQTSNRSAINTDIIDYYHVPEPRLFDTYPSITGYSLRQLLSTATYALRVRRSSDSAEQDIGFDSEGNLDTTSLETFCSGTNGYVRTWYNQGTGGGTYDLQQTSTSNQPQIVSSGSVITLNGKPTLSFNGSNSYLNFPSGFLYNVTAVTNYFMMAAPLQINDGIMGPGNTNTRGYELVHTNQVSWPTLVRINGDNKYETGAWKTNNTQGLTTVIANNSSTTVWLDGSGLTPVSGISAISWNGVYSIGRYSNGAYSEMSLQEFILDTSDQTLDRAAVETDLTQYYIGSNDVTGTGALTLPALGTQGAGTQTIVGSGAVTIPAVTAEGDGSFVPIVSEFKFLNSTNVDEEGNLSTLYSIAIDKQESMLFLGKTDNPGVVRSIHTYRYTIDGALTSLVKNTDIRDSESHSGIQVDPGRKFLFDRRPRSYSYDSAGVIVDLDTVLRDGSMQGIDTDYGVIGQEWGGNSGWDSLKYNVTNGDIAYVQTYNSTSGVSDSLGLDTEYKFFIAVGLGALDTVIHIISYDINGNLSTVQNTALGYAVDNSSFTLDSTRKMFFVGNSGTIEAFTYDVSGNITQVASTPVPYNISGNNLIDTNKQMIFKSSGSLVSYQYALDGTVELIDYIPEDVDNSFTFARLEEDNTMIFVFNTRSNEVNAYSYAPRGPQNLTAEIFDNPYEIFISWAPLVSVDGYEAYRDISPNFDSSQLVRAYLGSDYFFKDTVPYLDVTYYYRVRGYRED